MQDQDSDGYARYQGMLIEAVCIAEKATFGTLKSMCHRYTPLLAGISQTAVTTDQRHHKMINYNNALILAAKVLYSAGESVTCLGSIWNTPPHSAWPLYLGTKWK